MLINQVFLISLILGSPIYVALQASLLVIPPYALLLAIALTAAMILLKTHNDLGGDEILTFLVLLIGLGCALGGLALAPLPIQLVVAGICWITHQRYLAGVRP